MEKVEFVAEVSSNHNGDLDRCLKFVEEAKNCGCSGVKFQLSRYFLWNFKYSINTVKQRWRKERRFDNKYFVLIGKVSYWDLPAWNYNNLWTIGVVSDKKTYGFETEK